MCAWQRYICLCSSIRKPYKSTEWCIYALLTRMGTHALLGGMIWRPLRPCFLFTARRWTFGYIYSKGRRPTACKITERRVWRSLIHLYVRAWHTVHDMYASCVRPRCSITYCTHTHTHTNLQKVNYSPMPCSTVYKPSLKLFLESYPFAFNL